MLDLLKKIFADVQRSPERWLLLYMFFSILVWTLQCSLLQNIQGLDALEAVSWGNDFSWGNAKHPPLSGWAAAFFSVLAGRADWGLYFGCQLLMALGVWFVFLTVRMFADRYAAAVSAALLYTLFYYLPSWMKFSTYFVEMALCPMAAWAFFTALERKKWTGWLWFGLFCGLGMLNKYSFGLQIAGFGIVFLAVPAYRKKLFSPGPWLALGLGLLILLPHLQWLVRNDFCCLQHVQDRMEEASSWYDPFVLLTAGIYPLASSLFFLYLVRFAGWRQAERKKVNHELLFWTMLLSQLPVFVYMMLEFCGGSVIIMWLCSAASWSGAAAAALFPYRITAELWRRLFLLLIIITLAVLTGTTLDLLYRSVFRIHTCPEQITRPALEFWHARRTDAVPAVYGGTWAAGVLCNYLPERPCGCMADEHADWVKYRPLIEEKGALLIGRPSELDGFEKLAGMRVERIKSWIRFKALLGSAEAHEISIGYYPSRQERQNNNLYTRKAE